MYTIYYKSVTAILSMLFFALTVPLRIMGYAEHFDKPYYVITQVVLPVLSAVSMIAVIIFSGQKSFWISVFPLTLGILSFIFKLFIDPRYTGILHHIACVILYSSIVVLWLLTVLHIIKTKWILAALFAIPFFIHIFAEDLPVLLGKTASLSASMWLKEGSMLCTMLALFFCALSFYELQ